MSARFGRNKRRQAREAIASLERTKVALEQAVDTTQERYRSASNEAYALRDEIERAKRIAGLGSVLFLDPPSVKMRGRMPERSISVAEDEPEEFAGGPVSSASFEAIAYRTRFMQLDVFLTSVETRWSGEVHAMVEFADERAYYAVSPRSLLRMSEKDAVRVIAKNIAPALASHLMHALRKKGVRR